MLQRVVNDQQAPSFLCCPSQRRIGCTTIGFFCQTARCRLGAGPSEPTLAVVRLPGPPPDRLGSMLDHRVELLVPDRGPGAGRAGIRRTLRGYQFRPKGRRRAATPELPLRGFACRFRVRQLCECRAMKLS
jgi:hypothetical protein